MVCIILPSDQDTLVWAADDTPKLYSLGNYYTIHLNTTDFTQ